MTRYFLGIDGGGTKTEAVLLADDREIGRAASGPSNYHTVGENTAQASLQEAIHGALSAAGVTKKEVTAIGLGLAGVARPDDWEIVRTQLTRIGPFARIALTHDAEAALIGGVGQRHGIVLIAGTGTIAYGVNVRGTMWRADGWGYLLGDEGSAYWIGHHGLRAVVRAYDGRGHATALEKALLASLELTDIQALVTRAYGPHLSVPQIAALAPVVRQTAASGDAVAQRILQQAGQRLGETLNAVIHRLDMEKETFEVVLAGGVLQNQDVLREAVIQALRTTAPQAQAIEPRYDAATGAALLARMRKE